MSSTVISAAGRIPPPLKKAAPYILLVLAVLAAYSNVYGNAFVYDDISTIVADAFLRSWHYLGTIFVTPVFAGAAVKSHYYRPLQILLYLIIYQTAGLSTVAFHALNVSLHAANACLIYTLGRKLAFNPVAVFLATLIWALHPLDVEAVTYMNATADVLYVFFTLLTVLALFPDFAPRRIWMATSLLILALLSKEDSLMAPFVAMSCLFLVSPQRYSIKNYLRFWPWGVVLAAYALAHVAFNAHMGEMRPPVVAAQHAEKIHGLYLAPPPYTNFAVLAAYLKLLVVPVNLYFDRDFPFYTNPWHIDVAAGLIFFLLAFYQIFWRQKPQNLPLSWGILWFAAAYFLHSGIPLTFDKPVWEHFMYLPSVGLLLGIGETAALILDEPAARKYRGVNIIAALLIAASFASVTYKQNTVWRDSETLYLNIFKNGGTSANAHTNLGVLYSSRGEHAKAMEQYDLAIQISGDTVPEAQYHYALDLLAEPGGNAHKAEAVAHLKRALEIDPDYYFANKELAGLYDSMGDKAEARIYRDKAEALHQKLTPGAP